MVTTFRTPANITTIKRETEHYSLIIPIFDAPGWGRYMEDNLDIIDALLKASIGLIDVAGIWENDTEYTVGIRVIDNTNGSVYTCLVEHTSAASGTFEADRTANPTYWQLTQTGWNFRGAWTGTTTYSVGDVVYDTSEHVVAVCTTPHTSTTDIRTDAANWQFIVDLKTTVEAAESAKDDAEAAELAASGHATTASGHATTATNQATIATNKATEASGYAASASADKDDAEAARDAAQLAETNAETHATNAGIAKTDAESALAEFYTHYLGEHTADPTLDLLGNPIEDGAWYWNTSIRVIRIWDEGTASWYSNPTLANLATDVEYDNNTSGLIADDVQAAIDELAASGGGGTWGSITGTLADQTDLQSALDGKQPIDPDLTAIAALTTAAYGRALLELANEAAFKAAVNLEIGTDVQAWSANLDEYASVNPTAAGLALLDDVDADAQLATLGFTASITELNYTDGVTSGIQSQLDDKLTADGVKNSIEIDSGELQLDGDSATPGSNMVYGTDGAGAKGWKADPAITGTNELFIPATAFTPQLTNGAAAGIVELSTSLQPLETLDFDTSTQEFAVFPWAPPKRWALGTITATFYWTAASGSGGVAWALQGVAVSNDDALNGSYGTEQVATDTFIAANDLHITSATSAITIGGTPADADLVWLRVKRVPANGSDTLGVDAKLIGVKIFYTVDQGNDA